MADDCVTLVERGRRQAPYDWKRMSRRRCPDFAITYRTKGQRSIGNSVGYSVQRARPQRASGRATAEPRPSEEMPEDIRGRSNSIGEMNDLPLAFWDRAG